MSHTFVLMHGAWHGGWGYNPVAAHLRAAGHTVALQPTAPGLGDDDPRGVGLADVVDHLVGVVERADLHDVVLVGHSWGGMVLTAAAPRLRDRLSRLVYFSAFVPEAGESLYDLVPPDYQGLFDQLAGASDDNTVAMPLEVWQGGFMQDASPHEQVLAHSLMKPHPYATFTDAVGSGPGDLGVPTSYVISPDDIALPPGPFGWAPRFPDRLPDTRVVETVGSHESLFTAPAAIAGALVEAAD
ncbi:alpha/beta fold hydrolase [Nocardioides sp. CFH 31398]|uniref:alpha/beta fold hydrolase n=1 Tax=Nocardioides sp. CFH 31398 TaxID=2919579 RepID=UPI001F062E0B|nr:alpha/beta fold hydrolase [Nocardioides sp. CFH 31398]MCH1865470.1 alpha/beta fold hydrolase [Nocardioides sp. CFH 31398]